MAVMVAVIMRKALEAVLAFYHVGPWDAEQRLKWFNLTGCEEASTHTLCDTVRRALAQAADLNEIHEAEKTLTDDQYRAYIHKLVEVCISQPDAGMKPGHARPVSATAAQRLQALHSYR